MFRYLTINSWSSATLAGLIAGVLVLQTITPIIAYGMTGAVDDEQQTTEEPAEQETTSHEPLPNKPDEQATAENPVESAESLPAEGENQTNDDPVPETTIDTGDAVAGTDIETEANLTEIATEEEQSDTEATQPDTSDNSKEEPLQSDEEVIDNQETDTTSITTEDPSLLIVNSDNTATTTTNATTTAETGKNSATGGDVTITTGDAIAYTDVLNVVNTSLVNSDGLVKFVNETLGYKDFDLRDDFDFTYAQFDTSETTANCSLDSCNDGTKTNINSDNTATIENNLTVTANTGNNKASGTKATINTGNAYASANLINVANTNITDSNYLLLVFNNFADFSGDIVLPNSSFFDTLMQNSGGAGNVDLDISNSAIINNNIETTANTGNNMASGDNAIVTTGTAETVSTITNHVNQNIIGGNSFSMLIRVHGDWSGSISGLPDGLTWRETDQGIEIVSNSNSGDLSTHNLSQTTNNTATINNNVQVFALTGDNEAAAEGATIHTGNARADSSILNVANTSIIGSNWSNLIFTIYGNWSGNVTFGQPDLWLGVTANSPDNPIMPGSEVTYTYTVFNHGDVTAPEVILDSVFENSILSFEQYDQQSSLGPNTQNSWSLGDIEPGETREFSHTATVSNALDNGVVSAIPLTSRVTSAQKDSQYDDNEEVVTIYVGEKRSQSESTSPTFFANFDIEKTASRDLAQPGDTVEYTVTFFNHGGQLYDALLVDTLQNEEGEIIQQQSWPFEEIKNWETVTVTYSIAFDSAIEAGTYTNHAQLIGFHGSRKAKYQTAYESPIASHSLGLGTTPEGEVLGMSTTNCPPYLTEYMRYGEENNAEEVRKLQRFLSNELNRNLTVSGVFDLETEQAVRDFQIIHREEILDPWGLNRDSGYVYYTTQKKINEIMCGGTVDFPLASKQQQEIESFRKKMRDFREFTFSTSDQTEPAKPETITTSITPTPTIRKVDQVKESVLSPEPERSPEPVNFETRRIWAGITDWWQAISSLRLFNRE